MQPEAKEEKEFINLIAKRIKKIRLQKGFRQNEIAYRCNFDKSSYHNIEAGKRNITVTTLLKIARALEVEVIDFLN